MVQVEFKLSDLSCGRLRVGPGALEPLLSSESESGPAKRNIDSDDSESDSEPDSECRLPAGGSRLGCYSVTPSRDSEILTIAWPGWSGPGPGGRTIDLDESASLSLSVFNLKLPVVPAGGSRLGCDLEIWTIA